MRFSAGGPVAVHRQHPDPLDVEAAHRPRQLRHSVLDRARRFARHQSFGDGLRPPLHHRRQRQVPNGVISKFKTIKPTT